MFGLRLSGLEAVEVGQMIVLLRQEVLAVAEEPLLGDVIPQTLCQPH